MILFECVNMITIINGKINGFENTVYIGRRNARYNLIQSPLANPFTIGRDGNRDVVIEKYRHWLWAQIKNGNTPALEEFKRLALLYKEGNLTLSCWCKPLPCHGDIIIRALEWYSRLTGKACGL